MFEASYWPDLFPDELDCFFGDSLRTMPWQVLGLDGDKGSGYLSLDLIGCTNNDSLCNFRMFHQYFFHLPC